jgi:hypothetical protein
LGNDLEILTGTRVPEDPVPTIEKQGMLPLVAKSKKKGSVRENFDDGHDSVLIAECIRL